MSKVPIYHRQRNEDGGFDLPVEGEPSDLENYSSEGVVRYLFREPTRCVLKIHLLTETVASFVARGGDEDATPPEVGVVDTTEEPAPSVTDSTSDEPHSFESDPED